MVNPSLLVLGGVKEGDERRCKRCERCEGEMTTNFFLQCLKAKLVQWQLFLKLWSLYKCA